MLFKFASVGQSPSDAAVYIQTLHGNSLKPLAPVNIRGTRNAAGDLTIQWDRRSRIGPGLRPSTGGPLAEERELYQVEVYNGSSLVDTWRVAPTTGVELPHWLITKDTKRLASVQPDGTVKISTSGATSGNVLMLSQQAVYADEVNLISFSLRTDFPATLPRNIGLLSESSLVDDLTGIVPTFGWARGSVGQALTIEEFNFSDALSSGLVSSAETWLTIRLANNAVSYYQDRIDDYSLPYISTTAVPGAASGAYRLYIREPTPNGNADVVGSIQIQRTEGLAIYTANQQFADFGSVQPSIKVRIYQLSALVGRGAYVEATL